MGDSARGLFRTRRHLGLFSARAREKPSLPMGRRWIAWHYRPPVPSLLRFGAMERKGCNPEGTSVRTHRPEGNHGEDCKECYYYLDSSPTHSYLKALYKYPQNPLPSDPLVHENRGRALKPPEYELLDTGA